MNSKHTTPENYFNATDMLPEDDEGRKILSPHHFLDNKRVQKKLESLGKECIIYKGRGGCTFIPLELKYLFIAWLAMNATGT